MFINVFVIPYSNTVVLLTTYMYIYLSHLTLSHFSLTTDTNPHMLSFLYNFINNLHILQLQMDTQQQQVYKYSQQMDVAEQRVEAP